MLYAVIARPPVLGGKVKRLRCRRGAEGARRGEGVRASTARRRHREFHPLGGVVVVANDTWAAIKGREALKIDWDDGANASYDSDRLPQAELEAAAPQARRQGGAQRGRRYGGAGQGSQACRGRLLRAALAHATMEPPVATARIVDGRCEVWAPHQAPQAARDHVAKRLDLTPDKVTVQRHACSAAASAASRRPISSSRRRWSRRRWTASR